MHHRLRVVTVFLALALLAGCGKGESALGGLDGTSCYPPEAAQWIAETSGKVESAAADPGGAFTVYLDGSASMVGYIRGGTADTRPLADLVGMLPTLSGIDHSKSEVIRFDRKIATISSKDLQAMESESGYLCPAGNPNCDSRESHLDQALAKMS